jgi:hypothetical protein
MNTTILKATLLLSALAITTNVNAQPQYVAYTGVPDCTTCHYDLFGSGYKPGVLNAYFAGGLPGLKAFVNPTVTPDTAPVLSAINDQWDVTVGEVGLVIPLSVSDKEGDSFNVKGSVVPTATGLTFSTLYTDSKTNLPTKDVKWSPTAVQANKNYTFSLYVQESSTGHTLTSNTVKANVRVWPARTTATKNVKQFVLQNAQWTAATKKLTLSGLVTFKPTVTATQRQTYLSTLKMNLRSNLGAIVTGSPVKLVANAAGAWTSTFTLSPTTVPCLIKVDYEGLNAARTVKTAPAATCVK